MPRKPHPPLEPLAPMHDLMAVVRGLIAFPKERMDEIEANRPKRPRRAKKPPAVAPEHRNKEERLDA